MAPKAKSSHSSTPHGPSASSSPHPEKAKAHPKAKGKAGAKASHSGTPKESAGLSAAPTPTESKRPSLNPPPGASPVGSKRPSKNTTDEPVADAPPPPPAKRELTDLDRELIALNKEMQVLEKEISQCAETEQKKTIQHYKYLEEIQQLEKEMADSEKALANAVAEESELEMTRQRLDGEVATLRRMGMAKPDMKASKEDEEVSDEEKRAKREILRLRSNIQVERSAKELQDLRLEELRLLVEDIHDEIKEAEDPAFFSEENQLKWHQEALAAYISEHKGTIRRLKNKETELVRAKVAAEEADREGDVDIEAIKKAFETKKGQFEAADMERKSTEVIVEERIGYLNEHGQLDTVCTDLEYELRQEINHFQGKCRHLQAVATTNCMKREELRKQQMEAEAEVARLDIRLQTVKAQKERVDLPAADTSLVPSSVKELDAVKAGGNAQAGVARAVAFALCLSPMVKDEAELGQSFTTLTSLHRVFSKAQIITCCIHQHYIQDASLAVLQSSAPMEWLCRACLAAALISYSGAGVLGRLHAASPDKYRKVIRSPALKSCGNGEKALDAAISVLLDALMDSLGPRGAPKDVLSNMKALGAQIASVEKAVFKDEPFVSWQSVGCAIESCRAACAFALYASNDAGGSRRNKWQDLYNKANTLRGRVGNLSNVQIGAAHAFEVEPNILKPQEEEDIAPNVDGEEGAGDTPAPASPKSPSSPTDASERALDQVTLDNLLLQMKVLEVNAYVEPADETGQSDLDFALTQTATGLNDILKASRAYEKKLKAGEIDEDASAKDKPKPWIPAREAFTKRVARDLETCAPEKKAGEEGLKACEKAVAEIEEKVANTVEKLKDVEKQFSVARVEAERCKVTGDEVEKLRTHAESHVVMKQALENELRKEQDQAREVQQQTQTMAKRCRELSTQLADVEARIKKKYTTGVSPEDVIALRRTDTRQQRDIVDLRCRRARARCGPKLPLRPGELEMQELIEHGRETRAARQKEAARLKAREGSESVAVAGGDEKDKEEKKLEDLVATADDELSSIWLRLRRAQGELLMEQVSTEVVDLEAPSSVEALEEKNLKLQAATFESSQLKDSVQALMQDLAGIADASDGLAHGSVAFARYLRSTSRSIHAGPCMKLSLPVSNFRGIKDSKGGVLPTFCDLADIGAIHKAILPV